MRRLLRWAFNSAAALSAFLFVAMFVLRCVALVGARAFIRQEIRVQGWQVDEYKVRYGWSYGALFCEFELYRYISYNQAMTDLEYKTLTKYLPYFTSDHPDAYGPAQAWYERNAFDFRYDPEPVPLPGCTRDQQLPRSDYAVHRIVAPFFGLLLLLVTPAALWAASRAPNWWRFVGGRRAARAGLCRCGYDLRATLGRCPECGTVPAMKRNGTGTQLDGN